MDHAAASLNALERGAGGSPTCIRDVHPSSQRSLITVRKSHLVAAAVGIVGLSCVALASRLVDMRLASDADDVSAGGHREPIVAPPCSIQSTLLAEDSSETEAILNTSLRAYAADLKNSIVGAASGMIGSVAGLDGSYVVPEWNATAQDEGFKGLKSLSCPMRRHAVSLFDLFAERKYNFTADLLRSVFPTRRDQALPLAVGYVAAAVENWNSHGQRIAATGEAVHAQALAEKVLVETGGGFGFGLQIYCGCTLLMTTGGGFGFGMVMGNETSKQLSGGGGGGGGLQLFQDGKPDAGKIDTPVVNIGGGGGGTLTSGAGSTDFGQLTPVKSMELARLQIIAPQIETCPASKLSVVGGGGGGMGFTVSSLDGGVVAYGGGLDLRFSSPFAAENDRLCDGALLSGHNQSDSDSQAYDQINNATGECRKQCLQTMSVQKDPASFWKCSCPCQQKAFRALSLPFAEYMRCD